MTVHLDHPAISFTTQKRLLYTAMTINFCTTVLLLKSRVTISYVLHQSQQKATMTLPSAVHQWINNRWGDFPGMSFWVWVSSDTFPSAFVLELWKTPELHFPPCPNHLHLPFCSLKRTGSNVNNSEFLIFFFSFTVNHISVWSCSLQFYQLHHSHVV